MPCTVNYFNFTVSAIIMNLITYNEKLTQTSGKVCCNTFGVDDGAQLEPRGHIFTRTSVDLQA